MNLENDVASGKSHKKNPNFAYVFQTIMKTKKNSSKFVPNHVNKISNSSLGNALKHLSDLNILINISNDMAWASWI